MYNLFTIFSRYLFMFECKILIVLNIVLCIIIIYTFPSTSRRNLFSLFCCNNQLSVS